MIAKQTKQNFLNDNIYIKGLIQHDKKILENIYKNFSKRIENHIIKNGGTTEDARDVFQDALMVIYNKSQKKDFELTSQFYTYLFGIARFIWVRKRQKKSNNTVSLDKEDTYRLNTDIEADLIAQERHNIYRSSFMKLGTFCQQILELSYAKKKMEEITQIMGLKNEHTARNRKYRCQKKLEEFIKSDIRYKELSEK